MAATILITRPEAAALAFADQLRARLGCGASIVISPVLKIELLTDRPPVGGIGTLVFTSAHAVEAFAAMTDERALPCYTVGTATAKVARQAGFAPIDGGGTARTLAEKLIAQRPSTPILYLRGEHIACDLAETLADAGLETREVVVYRQVARELSSAAKACLAEGNPVILPLFSSRSAALFFEQVAPSAPVWVAAMSDNVARTAQVGPVARLEVADSPTAEAMLETVAQLYDAANQLEGDEPPQ